MYREQSRFFPGILSLTGFSSSFISVNRHKRFAGLSSYTTRKLIHLAFDLITTYSDKPLRISIFIGLLISGIAFLLGICFLFLSYSGIVKVSGWLGIMISIYLIGGIIITNLGVIGYYISKIFNETKRRPLYLIEDTTFRISQYANDNEFFYNDKGSVLWITGLSGSGKSSLAKEVSDKLRKLGRKTVVFDGDELREVFGIKFSDNESYNRDERLSLAVQYSKLCKTISSQGFTIIIATISLFEEIHSWNRINIPNYFEVYLKVPIEELRRRDSKKIYSRFDLGDLKNVAGLDLKIDEPKTPDFILEFNPKRSISDSANQLINFFIKKIKNESKI